MVPDELVGDVSTVHPVGCSFVQLGPFGLGNSSVRDVADEGVVEAEAVVVRRMQERSPFEPGEVGVVEWTEILDVGAREMAADDRRAAEDVQLARVETVETTCDQCFDRRRRLLERDIGRLRGECEQLLGEERIPARVLDDTVLHVGCNRAARKLLDQGRDLLRRQRIQLDHESRRRRATPAGPRLEQVAARDAQDQHRRVDPLAEVLDEIEQRRLRPVDVVERDDQRPLPRDRLEQAANRPERLARRGRSFCPADDLGDTLRDLLRVFRAGEQRRDPRHRRFGCGLLDDLGDREIRGAGAVRHTTADEDARLALGRLDELAREPRLADSRFAEDGDDAATIVLARALECGPKPAQLPLTAHERRIETALDRGRTRDELVETPAGEAVAELHTLGADGVLDEPLRLVAEQDLVRFRAFLEMCGDVERCAEDEGRLARAGDDHFARVDGDADGSFDVPAPLRLLVHARDRETRVDGGPHRAQRVVLVSLRDAEEGHNRVADELLHRSAVRLDGTAYRVEVQRQQPTVGLRIEPGCQPRRVDDVAEEDADGTARLGRRLFAAGRTERRVLLQDLVLERAQLLARLEPELLVEHASRFLVSGERVRLPPRAVQRLHLLAAEPLTQGVPGDQLLELVEELGAASELEVRRDPVLDRREAALREQRDLLLRKLLEGEILERIAAPERERRAQQLRTLLQRRALGLFDEPLETG